MDGETGHDSFKISLLAMTTTDFLFVFRFKNQKAAYFTATPALVFVYGHFFAPLCG
jgi:hypothetical protein